MTALTAPQLQASRRTGLNRVPQSEADRGAVAAQSSEVTAAETGNQWNLGRWPPVRVSLAQRSHVARKNQNLGEKFRPRCLDGGWLDYLSSAPGSTTLRCGFLQPQLLPTGITVLLSLGEGEFSSAGWNLGQPTEYSAEQIVRTWPFIIDYSIIFYNMYLLLYNI